jgi:hypothetical protein
MTNPAAPYQAEQTALVDRSMFLPGQQDLAQQPASTYQPPVSNFQQPVSATQPPVSAYQQPATVDPRENQHADWIAPAAVGAGAGVAGTTAYNHYNHDREPEMQQHQRDEQPVTESNNIASNPVPTSGVDTTPVVAPVPAPASIPTSSPFTSIDRAFETTPPATGLPGSVDNPPLATAHTTSGGTYLSYPAETGTGLAGASSASPVTGLGLEQGLNGSTPSPVTGLDQSANGHNVLGGHESKGAHETGRFPKVVRHDTDISVSQLHVPGEFPERSSGL